MIACLVKIAGRNRPLGTVVTRMVRVIWPAPSGLRVEACEKMTGAPLLELEIVTLKYPRALAKSRRFL